MPDQRYLITGGAGFIGSQLAGSFAGHHAVTCFDDLSNGDRSSVPDQATFFEGNVRDSAAVTDAATNADVIFHNAALVDVTASIKQPAASHATNVEGTISILEAAREHDARVVFASSAAVYGHPEIIPIREPHRKEPTSPYGLDKLTCDHYTRLYADLYDVETVALRYFNVYGPGQAGGDYSGVISVFIEQALNDDPITVHGDGTQTRDFVFVDDVVQANRLAARIDISGTAFNVGTGHSISIRELAELVQRITDSDSDIVHNDARSADIQRSEADITKSTDLLGYEPSVSIREGLERTVQWYYSREES